MLEYAGTIAAESLRGVYHSVAVSLGANDEDASIYAACLAQADLRHDTQGLPLWLEWSLPMLEAGGAKFDAELQIVHESDASLVIDGSDMVGQIAATKAMAAIIRKSKACGAAFGVVRGTSDIAMTANYAMLALEQDCIGIVASTAGPPNVAPWGGRDAMFGPDPLSAAIPTASINPLVIDMCCATYSIGTLVEAARAGHTNCNTVVVDRDGQYLRDAAAILSDLTVREPKLSGAILPEGPKGSALLLLVELLAGILSGNGTSFDQMDWTVARPPRVGVFLCAIDVAQFLGVSDFKARVASFAELLRLSAPAQGFAQVIVPGDRAARLAEERRRDGCPVSIKHAALLRGVCDRHAVAMPSIQRP